MLVSEMKLIAFQFRRINCFNAVYSSISIKMFKS